jgi:hypothetical protein
MEESETMRENERRFGKRVIARERKRNGVKNEGERSERGSRS